MHSYGFFFPSQHLRGVLLQHLRGEAFDTNFRSALLASNRFVASGSMGSVDPHKWYQCDWCEWWGKCSWDVPDRDALINFDSCDGLCFICLRCHELDEPPWRPNNRDRYYMSMQRLGFFKELPHTARRDIACYLAKNSK